MCTEWRNTMVKIEIKGLDKLQKKIEKLEKELPKVIEKSVEDILKETRTCAIRIERGHNEQGILCELVDVADNQVKGHVYTDKENFGWAMFEHWGTGDYREMDAVGTTKHFIETGGSQWFIPVDKVKKTLHYPIIEIQGMQFYLAHGYKATHFMTDAEFETRNKNVENVEQSILKLLKEVCK